MEKKREWERDLRPQLERAQANPEDEARARELSEWADEMTGRLSQAHPFMFPAYRAAAKGLQTADEGLQARLQIANILVRFVESFYGTYEIGYSLDDTDFGEFESLDEIKKSARKVAPLRAEKLVSGIKDILYRFENTEDVLSPHFHQYALDRTHYGLERVAGTENERAQISRTIVEIDPDSNYARKHRWTVFQALGPELQTAVAEGDKTKIKEIAEKMISLSEDIPRTPIPQLIEMFQAPYYALFRLAIASNNVEEAKRLAELGVNEGPDTAEGKEMQAYLDDN